ncbi:ParB/RepB/Spo0J family partition protein [Burkholderia perseverans]|uniref:ParB/RepB/Spo0J family partition protein n=1 Tax=Burkholderia perseverans TaxID=2615214 RepID=UPI001FEE4DD9|nr:ParB N-terminal domain-containing protein [Burkholderia perseverans]
MAKNSVEAYGAEGKTNSLFFDPEKLVLVTDKASPLYDERVHLPVDEAMAHSIDYLGVQQPIVISKNPETGETEVVVGRQRVKAARLANVWRKQRGAPPRKISAIVFQGKRETAIETIVAENEQRQADSPLGRAEKMRQVLSLGRSEGHVAMIFNCSVATVRSSLALLECCAETQRAVESGKVPLTHASKLATMKPDQQRTTTRELVAAANTHKPRAAARAQREVMGDKSARMKTRKQIEAEADKSTGDYSKALRWVLNADIDVNATNQGGDDA